MKYDYLKVRKPARLPKRQAFDSTAYTFARIKLRHAVLCFRDAGGTIDELRIALEEALRAW